MSDYRKLPEEDAFAPLMVPSVFEVGKDDDMVTQADRDCIPDDVLLSIPEYLREAVHKYVAAHAAQARKEGAQEVLAKLRDLPIEATNQIHERMAAQLYVHVPHVDIRSAMRLAADALEGEL